MMNKKGTQNLKLILIKHDSVFLETLQVYFDAHRFIWSNNLGKFLWISGLFFLLLFSASIKAINHGIDILEAPFARYLLPLLQQFVRLSSDDVSKGVKAGCWLLKKAIEKNQSAIFSFIFLIVGTPFFSFLSGKTEELHTGQLYPFRWPVFFKELRRGVSLSVRNSVKQFGLIIIITIIGLNPLLGIITPLLSFIVQCYFNGLLLTDYTLERKGYSVKNSEEFYRVHKTEMFAVGLGFMLLLLIPVVGWFLSPAYAIVASYLFFSNQKVNSIS